MATCLHILSPAKINLFLHVLRRRPDGYHDLFSLMCPIGLYDRILIKDNHRAWWASTGSASRADAVREARRHAPGLLVEIEVESEAELLDALEGRPDWIMIDNRPADVVRRWIELVDGRCKVELSGGINLETIAAYAAARPDAISVGALTHSAPAADLSLEFDQ